MRRDKSEIVITVFALLHVPADPREIFPISSVAFPFCDKRLYTKEPQPTHSWVHAHWSHRIKRLQVCQPTPHGAT